MFLNVALLLLPNCIEEEIPNAGDSSWYDRYSSETAGVENIL